MKALDQFSTQVEVLFTDIDDTLTWQGQLPPQSYEMLWKLTDAGVRVVPVTGRPAGWCEMIARLWPVEAVIGENGAFYFQYKNKKMHRHFQLPESERQKNQQKLQTIQDEVLSQVPGSALASDQFTRLFDLAIDFCEDIPPLSSEAIAQIVALFEKHGAVAKVSSIHVNGWFGDYDKSSMCKKFLADQNQGDLEEWQSKVAFAGDSPNDEPLFQLFDHSVAVANILKFTDQLKHKPKFVTPSEASKGFVELGERILSQLSQ